MRSIAAPITATPEAAANVTDWDIPITTWVVSTNKKTAVTATPQANVSSAMEKCPGAWLTALIAETKTLRESPL